MLSAAWNEHQKMRFLAVGAWNTLFAYLAYGALYELLHERAHYIVISVATHGLAVANAFFCQRWLVFRSRSPWWSAFLRFNVVQLGVLAWGLAGIGFLVEIVHLRPAYGQIVVMSVAIVASYVLGRKYTFRGTGS
jgi:putative flippase GtrA